MTHLIPTADIVSLASAKEHMRLDSGDDDMAVDAIIEAARSYVEGWVGPLDEFLPGEVPYSVRQAMLMVVAHWFANREAAAEQALVPVPMGFHDLIEPHRRWEF